MQVCLLQKLRVSSTDQCQLLFCSLSQGLFIGYYLNEAQNEYCPWFKQKIYTSFAVRVCMEGDINSYNKGRFCVALHLRCLQKTTIMTTQKIAQRLTALCREGEFERAQKELYANDAVSIEPNADSGFEKETKGLQSILEKGKKFQGMIEKEYGNTISDPIVTKNSIAFKLSMDVEMKGHPRSTMEELCVYEVKDGKIVSEQFYM